MKLEWNAGAWFGSLFGMTLWMALAGSIALAQAPAAGATALLLFGITAGAGVLLWRRRERTSCYRALQGMLLLLAATGATTIFVLDRAGQWEALQGMDSTPASVSYVVLAAVLLTLHVIFRLRFGAAESERLRRT